MRLGITSGPAEGKSTVCGYLREAGFETVSADDLARPLFDEPAVQNELATLLSTAPPVSREKVRRAVFGDAGLRRGVNRILHRRILAALMASKATVIEAPLLLETGLQSFFDCIWVVTCGPEEQLRRLAERLGGEAEARRVIAAQLPTRVKCAFADRIVRTNSPPDTVRAYVIEAIVRDLADHLA